MHRALVLLASALLIVGCGGKNGDASPTTGAVDSGDATDTTSATTTDAAATLPAECMAAPYTVVASRDGEQPAGSPAFGVVGTAALPIPLVPDKAGAKSAAEVSEEGSTTDLLGYVLFFGDEQFGPSEVSMFGGYAPTAAGSSRGTISIFPKTTTPIAPGDTLTPGTLDGLEMVTTLQSVLMDFKATPDELTSYINDIAGRVTVLGLTDTELCLDVDLSWEYSNGATALGTLTLYGIFTAPLAPRSLPFT
jgi:hypothetical protein